MKETVTAPRRLGLEIFNRLAPLLVLLLMGVFLTLREPRFCTLENFRNIALQYAPLAIIAMGQTFVIIAGGIDLSVGSVLALSGVTAGLLMTRAGGPFPDHLWLAGLCGTLVGVGCGLLNGLIITQAQMPPFIVTLGMMGMARGGALILTGGNPIFGLPEGFLALAQSQVLGVSVPALLMLSIAVVAHVVLTTTCLGRYAYAIGGNPQASRLSGVPVDRCLIVIFALCGLLTGFAGVVLTSRLSSAQPTMGEMFELDAIAAAVIGGASLFGGQGTIPGTLIGVFIMAVLRNGCNLLGVSNYWQLVLIGAMIILAVFMDHWRRQQQRA